MQLHHQLLKTLQRNRFAEKIALPQGATVSLQKSALLLRLHALGYHINAQAVRHADHGLHDQCIGMLNANVAHKALVACIWR